MNPHADFSRQAASYDGLAGIQQQVAGSLALLLHGQSLPPGSWLDYGAGTGNASLALLRSGLRPRDSLWLADPSQAMLDQAAARLQTEPGLCLRLHCGLSESLPSYPCALILSSMALQWCPRLPQTLRELGSRLQDGGVLAIAVPVDGSFRRLSAALTQLKLPEYILRYPSIERLELACQQAGLAIISQSQEHLTQPFAGGLDLLRHLHRLGATLHGLPSLRPATMRRLISLIDAQGHPACADYQIAFILATPHQSTPIKAFHVP